MIKPKINIVFCEALQQTSGANSAPTIMNLFTTISPVAIPGNYTFSVLCSVANLPKSTKTLRLKIGIIDGELLFDTNQIDICQIPLQNDNYPQINIGADLRNIIIIKEGQIYAELYADNELIEKSTIDVIKPK